MPRATTAENAYEPVEWQETEMIRSKDRRHKHKSRHEEEDDESERHHKRKHKHRHEEEEDAEGAERHHKRKHKHRHEEEEDAEEAERHHKRKHKHRHEEEVNAEGAERHHKHKHRHEKEEVQVENGHHHHHRHGYEEEPYAQDARYQRGAYEEGLAEVPETTGRSRKSGSRGISPSIRSATINRLAMPTPRRGPANEADIPRSVQAVRDMKPHERIALLELHSHHEKFKADLARKQRGRSKTPQYTRCQEINSARHAEMLRRFGAEEPVHTTLRSKTPAVFGKDNMSRFTYMYGNFTSFVPSYVPLTSMKDRAPGPGAYGKSTSIAT